MKIMFLDESGDHSLTKIDTSYPMFVLAGCIFDLDYIEELEAKVDELKIRHFGDTGVILRSYDIRKQKKGFACLVDRKKRNAFYNDLNELIKELKFTVIAAAINKNQLLDQYFDPSNPYDLCLQFILERAIMYLGRSGNKMMFRIESRESHNDQKLAHEYEKFRSVDSGYFKKEEKKTKLVDLSFSQKSQNVAGMQIADLVAYPIGKWVLDPTKENLSFQMILEKIHKKNGKIINCGLKIFPINY